MKNPNKNQSIEINDLIADAVNNASVRRNQVIDSGADLSDLSDEEADRVAGGLSVLVSKPIILGKIYCPPITMGIIGPPIDKYLM